MRVAILLAAGRSRRFGAGDKLKARFRGEPIFAHALRTALAGPVGPVIVVLRGGERELAALAKRIGGQRIRIVRAGRDGVHRRANLRRALARLRPCETEALIYLGDMPGISPNIARRLLRHARTGEGARPVYRGIPGHPVLIRNSEKALRRLEQGLVPVAPEAMARMTGEAGSIFDIDRPGDLARGRTL